MLEPLTYEERVELDKKLLEDPEANMERNEKFFDAFREDLFEAGLKEETIQRHMGNIKYFLNNFMSYRCYESSLMEFSSNYVDEFMIFFVRKHLWSTPKEVKRFMVTFRKFYKSMSEHGYIYDFEYEDFKEESKELEGFWMWFCDMYNTPEVSLTELYDYLLREKPQLRDYVPLFY